MPWAAVIGSPIEHSLSPVLHRAAWDSLGLDGRWEYRRIRVEAADAAELLAGLDDECRGLSVTMPCKQAVIPALTALDPLARAVGAVNTVIPSAGILTGFNTDVHGIVESIRAARRARGLPPARSALVLGAGATASSALAALGTLGITRSTVAARRFAGHGSVVAAAMRLGVGIDQVAWADLPAVARAAEEADVVVSTVPAGVADVLVDRWRPREDQAVLDVVYSPRDTPMRRACEEAGACVVDGTQMLVHQAALQVRLMTGADPDVDAMQSALAEARG
ncbi:shikimate dehydrogenase [Actinomyces sp. B33]|uniref:shikimate dehydrogenase n=1 Tax=Actinomyces sp. B33 TaxID=2942131 RepID=UPI0023421317|nr:shikimate dehydrogenase [Actinomyces sp. B33]MDC4233249.1 shikimate dehydrogenase [Actinomyces sp. B33]